MTDFIRGPHLFMNAQRDIDVAVSSVCPSVRPSVCLLHAGAVS